ncbi:MAG: protein kinase [Planctomycetes bacterium]|nr:protein kinase [Planctomycetota bacterium]
MSLNPEKQKKVVAFFVDLLFEAPLCLVPGGKLAFKAVKLFDQVYGEETYGASIYDSLTTWITNFWAADDSETDKDEMLLGVQDASTREQIAAILKQRLSDRPDHQVLIPILCDVILDLANAARMRSEAPSAAEAVRRSVNESRKRRGQKPVQSLSREQRAVGGAVARSLKQRRGDGRPTLAGPAMPPLEGYRVLRPLGEGGEGQVFLAVHETTHELRAIKFGDLDEPDGFKEKMENLKRLDHPHLVRYRDYKIGKILATGAKVSWIIMDFVGENNLADVLTALKSGLQTDQALIIADQVLEGLAYLHQNGIIHRDLKPENVAVDDAFHIRLIDFGLAKRILTDGTATMGRTAVGDRMGTPLYMSPEQIHQKQLTAATDVWSFGAVLYELFIGKSLFSAQTEMALGHEIMTKELSFDIDAIPKEMRPLLARCLDKNVDRRYENAQTVLEEFRRAAEAYRRRLRHEYFLHTWLAVFEKRLLETFVAEHRAPFDHTTVARFREFAARHGIPELDDEALARVLPPTLAAQRNAEEAWGHLQAAKNRLEAKLRTVSADQFLSDDLSQLHSEIADLNVDYERAVQAVSATIKENLEEETKQWDQKEAERRKREQREEVERRKRQQQEKADRDAKQRKQEQQDREYAEARAKAEREDQEQAAQIVIQAGWLLLATICSALFATLGAVVGVIAGCLVGIPAFIIVGLATWNSHNGEVAIGWTATILMLLCVVFGAVYGCLSVLLGSPTSQPRAHSAFGIPIVAIVLLPFVVFVAIVMQAVPSHQGDGKPKVTVNKAAKDIFIEDAETTVEAGKSVEIKLKISRGEEATNDLKVTAMEADGISVGDLTIKGTDNEGKLIVSATEKGKTTTLTLIGMSEGATTRDGKLKVTVKKAGAVDK